MNSISTCYSYIIYIKEFRELSKNILYKIIFGESKKEIRELSKNILYKNIFGESKKEFRELSKNILYKNYFKRI